MLVASYTVSEPSDWLGGVDAYVSQTRRATERLITQIKNLNNDPMFLGHISERFARSSFWSIQNLDAYSENPIASKKRLNYHACAVASTTGEMLVGFEDISIYVTCSNERIRSQLCKKDLDNEFRKMHELKNISSLSAACVWSLPGE